MFPSVTEVLAPYSGIENLRRMKPGVIERAAARGTAVHGYCEAAAKGLFTPGVPLEHQGYLDSFMYWLADVEEVIACELRLMDSRMGFHGQFDILCRLRGDECLSVWDYKTPDAPSPTWGPQTAAYCHLCQSNGYDAQRGGTLRLRKTGRKPILNEYTDSLSRDWNIFISALNCHNAFSKRRRTKG